jgi:hypothetical protein
MRTRNGVLPSVAGLAVGLAVLPSASHAVIVEVIINPNIDATLGSITFPTLTGSSDAGVQFSLDSGHPPSEYSDTRKP